MNVNYLHMPVQQPQNTTAKRAKVGAREYLVDQVKISKRLVLTDSFLDMGGHPEFRPLPPLPVKEVD